MKKDKSAATISRTAKSRTIRAVGITVSLLLAVHGSPPLARGGESDPEPGIVSRYLILDAVRSSTMQKELSEAAVAGLSVITGDAGYDILVLEKDPTGKKHEYLFTDSLLRMVEKGESRVIAYWLARLVRASTR
jgi:hypothetical protein